MPTTLHPDVVKFFNGDIPGSPFGIKSTEWAFGTWLQGVDNESPPDGSITVDTISELTSAAGVTIDGLLIKDERIQVTGSGIATGDAGVTLKDNLASAWDFKESSNVYLRFVTTNDAERVTVGKLLGHSATTGTVAAPIDMAGATHTLVLGTASSAQTQLVGNMVFVDANTGSAPENLVLPSAATLVGVLLYIKNVGGEQVTVDSTVLTLEAGEGGFVVSDGTAWAGFGVGGNT